MADRSRSTGQPARFGGGSTRSLPVRRAGVGLNLTSFNRCNLPPWAIASRDFDENPRPLEVQGVRAENRFLFDLLDRIDDPDERGRRFDDWINVRFQLHQWEAQETAGARRSLRNGYPRFLRGWGVDSSSVEGRPEGLGGEPHGNPTHLPP
jgi:hypothetical protein